MNHIAQNKEQGQAKISTMKKEIFALNIDFLSFLFFSQNKLLQRCQQKIEGRLTFFVAACCKRNQGEKSYHSEAYSCSPQNSLSHK